MNIYTTPFWQLPSERCIGELRAVEVRYRPDQARNAKGMWCKEGVGGGGNSSESIDKSQKSGIMKLTGNDVIIPAEKLRNYSLSFEKCPDKARVFKSVLGFTANNAEILEQRIRESFTPDLLVSKGNKGYGELYEEIMPIKGMNENTAKVTTCWIDDTKKGEFRLTSAYINTNKGGHKV